MIISSFSEKILLSVLLWAKNHMWNEWTLFQHGKRKLVKKSAKVTKIGCLSNNYGDVSKKGKKAIGTIDWQNNKIGCASTFLLFLCCHCRTTTQKFLISHFVEDMNTRQDFLFLFLNFDTVFWNSTPEKNCQHLTNWTRWNEHVEVDWSSPNFS